MSTVPSQLRTFCLRSPEPVARIAGAANPQEPIARTLAGLGRTTTMRLGLRRGQAAVLPAVQTGSCGGRTAARESGADRQDLSETLGRDGELVRSAVMEMTPRSTRQPFSDLAPSRPPSPHQHRYVPVTRSGQTHLLRSRGCKHLLLCLSPCGGAEPNKFQWFLLSELCLLLLASEGNSARCHVLTLTAAGPTALGQATMPAASEPTSGATSQMTQEPCLACPSSAT